MTMPKKIFIITSSRAEYHLLKPLIKEIATSSHFNMELIVTGTHLEKKMGFTITDIQKDHFKIAYKVRILYGQDDILGINQAMSRIFKKFPPIFLKNRPDFICLLGDRYEIFGIACSTPTSNSNYPSLRWGCNRGCL